MLEIPKGGKKSKAERVLCLIRLLSEQTGATWHLRVTHPPLPLVHTMSQDAPATADKDEQTDAFLTKRTAFINKNKKWKDAFFCPKETALCPNLGKE